MDSDATPQDLPEDLPEDWYKNHFNHFSPHLNENLVPTLEKMRSQCPFAHSEELGGFWIATRYKDIQRVAQDWETFSSERGIVIPSMSVDIPVIPEQLDPPLHGIFKNIINQHLTPEAVAVNEAATRELIDSFIDAFIEQGQCEFMADFAVPMPGMILFDRYLNAPRDELSELSRLASLASLPYTEEGPPARDKILQWVRDFVEYRRNQPPCKDLVDSVINADIDGRPITDTEILGVIQLLIFGGLDTTSGALGHMMVRFCRQPEIPALLREKPELIPAATEELLRLDSPFVFIGRTATRDTEIAGHTVKAGEQVLMSWQSGNRDEEVFTNPREFDIERDNRKRHMAFGTGPHRCSGSNLALLNLRLSLEQLLSRLEDIRFADDAEPIPYHSGFNRSPRRVPIRFTPGVRKGNS